MYIILCNVAVDKYVHVLSLQETDVVEQKAAKIQLLISELC